MKRLTSLVFCILFMCSLAFCADAQTQKIIDNADLLSASEEASLEQKAQQLVDTYQMDVVILTVQSLDGKSSEAYADDYFDYNGYGIGADYSGILLLLSMEYRDWAMSTCGETIYAVTDYGIQSIFSEISDYLSNDRYYDAFGRYLEELDTYFSAYQSGNPIDGNAGGYVDPGAYIPGTGENIVYYDEPLTFGDYVGRFFIALVIGAVVAGIALLVMRGKMNTARPQSGAKSYLVSGSYHLYRHQDIFLYSRTTRTRKPENNGGGGGRSGGGGSSVHRSSSGRSHGGGHGRF